MTILAIDVGGTKIDVAQFGSDGVMVGHERVDTQAHPSLIPVIESLAITNLQGIGIAIGGPVTGRREKLTNLDWVIDADEVERRFAVPTALMNDMEAHALGCTVAAPAQKIVIQKGQPLAGNAAVIAPGTGLGEALLIRDGKRMIASTCEGGHASFAPTNAEEVRLLQFAMERFGHVSCERLVSGSLGLPLLLEFVLQGEATTVVQRQLLSPILAQGKIGGRIAQLADEGDAVCRKVLHMFARLLGSEAANLCLKGMATNGVYLCGAVPKKLARLLQGPEFIEGFCAKGRYSSFLSRIPITIVTDELNALHGIAAKLSTLS